MEDRMRLTTDEVFKEIVRVLEHAKARFECLADDFRAAGDDTADAAMCSVDAGMMEKTILLLQQRSVEMDAQS